MYHWLHSKTLFSNLSIVLPLYRMPHCCVRVSSIVFHLYSSCVFLIFLGKQEFRGELSWGQFYTQFTYILLIFLRIFADQINSHLESFSATKNHKKLNHKNLVINVHKEFALIDPAVIIPTGIVDHFSNLEAAKSATHWHNSRLCLVWFLRAGNLKLLILFLIFSWNCMLSISSYKSLIFKICIILTDGF